MRDGPPLPDGAPARATPKGAIHVHAPSTRLSTRVAALVLSGAAALGAASAAPASGSTDSAGTAHRDVCGAERSSRSVEVIGLTSNQRLICFRADKPERARTIGSVRGLVGDTRLVGIDVRPANAQLYGLGDQGGIYTLDAGSAAATKVAQTSLPLRGTSFGVDFNPAADRLRVTSDVGQNLRINVDGGVAIADGDLAYTPGTPATGVTGAAYTNNDADPNTGTTLFDVDSTLDQVAIQSPPNAGSLVATGKLGVDTGTDVAVDIASKIRRGTTVANTAYAALSTPDGSTFNQVDLLTGRATSTGRFARSTVVVGIAVPQG